MDHSLVVALVAGLGSMLGWGAADFFAKKTIDKIDDLRTLLWSQAVGIVPLLALFLVHPEVPKFDWNTPLILVAFGVVTALSYLPLYNGFGKGKVSVLSPIFASYAVVVAILSAVFFHEHMSVGRMLAIAVVFAGILLASVDTSELRQIFRRKVKSAAGVPEVLSAMLMYSGWLVLFDQFLQGKNWIPCLLIIRIVATLTLVVYAKLRRREMTVHDRKLWRPIAFIGICDVAAFSFVSYGFSHTHLTSVVAVLSATFSVPTIILAAIFLKERLQRLQLVAVLIILVGVALISLMQ